jgi:hypothetical protein
LASVVIPAASFIAYFTAKYRKIAPPGGGDSRFVEV